MNQKQTLEFFEQEVSPSDISPWRNKDLPVMGVSGEPAYNIPIDYENSEEIIGSNVPEEE